MTARQSIYVRYSTAVAANTFARADFAAPAGRRPKHALQQRLVVVPDLVEIEDAPAVTTATPSGRGRNQAFAALLAVVLVVGGLVGGLAFRATNKAAPAPATAALFAKAMAAQKNHELQKAENGYRAVLELAPNDLLAHFDLGTVYQAEGQLTSAYYAYEQALLIKANYVPALFNLAIVETASAPTSAAQLYKQIEQLVPNDPRAFFNLGQIDRSLGNQAGATAEFAQAVHLDPSLASSIPAGAR